MTLIDLTDPAKRAEAIRLGYSWSAPARAQAACAQDIVAGRVPMPEYELPPHVRALIAELREQGTDHD